MTVPVEKVQSGRAGLAIEQIDDKGEFRRTEKAGGQYHAAAVGEVNVVNKMKEIVPEFISKNSEYEVLDNKNATLVPEI